jgi:CPA1 family monovalent cation:H+ antiporter
VIGSIGLPLVLRRVPKVSEPESVIEERQARLAACRAAISSLAINEETTAQQPTEWQAQQHEIEGRIAREYRNRIDMLDEDRSPDAAEAPDAASPEAVQQRRERYVMELEMRLKCIKVERHTIYAERQHNRINDESLRSLVQELDLTEITLRKRLDVARRAAAKQAAKRESS